MVKSVRASGGGRGDRPARSYEGTPTLDMNFKYPPLAALDRGRCRACNREACPRENVEQVMGMNELYPLFAALKNVMRVCPAS